MFWPIVMADHYGLEMVSMRINVMNQDSIAVVMLLSNQMEDVLKLWVCMCQPIKLIF